MKNAGVPPARAKRQVEKYTDLQKTLFKAGKRPDTTLVYRLKGSTMTKMTKREQRAYLKSLEKK